MCLTVHESVPCCCIIIISSSIWRKVPSPPELRWVLHVIRARHRNRPHHIWRGPIPGALSQCNEEEQEEEEKLVERKKWQSSVWGGENLLGDRWGWAYFTSRAVPRDSFTCWRLTRDRNTVRQVSSLPVYVLSCRNEGREEEWTFYTQR